MGKLITIDYEEYLELERYKKVFDNLKYSYQEGIQNAATNKWTWVIRKEEFFDLLVEESMCPSSPEYDSILIKL